MRKRIIEAIFDGWCEGEYGTKPKKETDAQNAIDKICGCLSLSEKEELCVEENLMDAVCAHEKIAFVHGFCLCLELLNGNLIKAG